MTRKEKTIQIALGTYLDVVWRDSCRLFARREKLLHRHERLYKKAPEKVRNQIHEDAENAYCKGRRKFMLAARAALGKQVHVERIGLYDYVVNGRQFVY